MTVSPHPLQHLFDNNRLWVDSMLAEDPNFFKALATQQAPEYLWIGCSDSRVPANQITGLAPGEVFVHRNVANVVVHSDLNSLSVLQFAVDQLKVRHIMVVGHYGCSGVRAALTGMRVGIADNWLRHVRDVHEKHEALIERCPANLRHDRLCELNAMEQALTVCQTTVVQDAWERRQPVTVHAWVYGVDNGQLHDLGFTVSSPQELRTRYATTLELISARISCAGSADNTR
ncbi:carbonate dehydratase [Ferrovum sp.]|uniref:carbonate dehydratase n=1 Tax=Ferrovum sp. TaxID=2609467 RepID=UPI0026294F97|nr:carbonate dehydratase [Ferrovum sp.]